YHENDGAGHEPPILSSRIHITLPPRLFGTKQTEIFFDAQITKRIRLALGRLFSLTVLPDSEL
ncbi:MAG TPA: hypothetical protein VGJ30_08940, partial [Candidatus Angelobacter sp.]